MPRMKTETLNTGDQSWLGSDRGIFTNRTVLVDPTGFVQADNFPNGYIPSGTPVAIVGGYAVAYTAAEGTTTNTGVLAGHLFNDVPLNGTEKVPAPLYDHGRVRTAKVPKGIDTFTAPVAAAKRINVTIIYV